MSAKDANEKGSGRGAGVAQVLVGKGHLRLMQPPRNDLSHLRFTVGRVLASQLKDNGGAHGLSLGV